MTARDYAYGLMYRLGGAATHGVGVSLGAGGTESRTAGLECIDCGAPVDGGRSFVGRIPVICRRCGSPRPPRDLRRHGRRR